jgi:hypothetical protein
LVVSFLFPFLFGYQMCVLSMHSSRGRLRTMCGSSTGGWSLPGVRSDWQRCVDRFLAKYCRCRLRLDWCWCRWKTSASKPRSSLNFMGAESWVVIGGGYTEFVEFPVVHQKTTRLVG